MSSGMRWITGAVAVLALANLAAPGQRTSTPPVKVDYREMWDHIRGERRSIHIDLRQLSQQRQGIFEQVGLEVVVSENGIVDFAKAISGPPELYGQAEDIERHRSFAPFRKDGALVRAAVSDGVSIEPPERWADVHVPFPEKIDLPTVFISLRRTACYGTCADYAVAIHGNGAVEYKGTRFVRVTGAQTSHLSGTAVAELLTSFRKADFFSALDEYRAPITDLPAYIVTLKMGDRTKTVTDYAGGEVGLPDAIRDLERLIDETAETEKWVRGYKR